MLLIGGRNCLLPLLLALLSCVSLSAASSPTSFCKCTCFTNSTIIPLDPSKSESATTSDSPITNLRRFAGHADDKRMRSELDERSNKHRSLNCNDCTRKFCLDYDLPICEDAKEEDVYTECFQRDSRKDEAVVFIFIIATGGLLAWAVFKPWVEKWVEAARERRSYMPVYENPE